MTHNGQILNGTRCKRCYKKVGHANLTGGLCEACRKQLKKSKPEKLPFKIPKL